MTQYIHCMTNNKNQIWTPKIDKTKRGVYRAIVDAMRRDIEAGILKAGDQLPPQRELAWELQVNLTTISRAYREAMRQHLIGGEVGRGTYILANSAEASLFELHNKDLNKGHHQADFIDLSTNIPARNADDNRFNQSLQAITAANQSTLFEEYHAPILLEQLKIAATKWLNWRRMPAKPENIVLAGGAQTALQAILIALCNAGDSILVEQYTFPGMKDFARQFGLKLIPINMDEQGILPEDLAKIAAKTHAKYIILVPNHQNPTGAVMSKTRQQQIAKIIAAKNLTLIEDDVYGGLSPMPPLSACLPNHAIYLTSLSKTVSFGLRVGFIHAKAQHLDALTHATNLTQWTLSPIMMQMAINWIDDGTAFDKAAWQLAEIQERRKIADNILPKNIISTRDKNSPHLWINISQSIDIQIECENSGLNTAPVSIFLPQQRQKHQNHIRISLVAPATRQNLAIGLKRLASIIQ
ncbi:MAG: GntR family transcriptional regulator [Hyphomicrobiales bacterium]|nr:MAG: GntR family transcriptional regulator [Hyphomicrobiales bacterium]